MKREQQHYGFTLVEMMIALLVGSIVAAAAYQVLVSQSRVYEVQEQTTTMQRNARAALDFICQELRQVAYGVDEAHNPLVLLINNNVETETPVQYETDSISFIGNTIEGSIVAADAASSATALWVQPAPSKAIEFRESDVVNILNWNSTLIVEDLTVGSVEAVFEQHTKLTFGAPIGTEVRAGYVLTRQPVVITYRLNGNVLERGQGVITDPIDVFDDAYHTYQPLVGDVEDFQLVYAFDNDGDNEIDVDSNGLVLWAVDTDRDNQLDTVVKDDGTTEAMDVLVDVAENPRDCRVRAVRISILVRTERENPDPRFRSASTRPAVEDRYEGYSADGYRRCLLQRVVKFRNLGIG